MMTSLPAAAQRFEAQQLNQRINNLEAQIQQRAMAPAPAIAPSGGGFSNAGQVGAELARIEEEVRQIRGEQERLSFQIKQVQDQQRLFQEDIEFRLSEVAQTANGGGNNGGSFIPENAPLSSAVPPSQQPFETQPPVIIGAGTAPAPQSLNVDTSNMSARDVYNRAFQMLNQTDYEGAERSFLQFTKQFPNDPLIGNAWYWLGETHYVRRDYVQAADSFRQGFQVMETGPKAGDNLLKLAMSLAAMEKDKEACIVLKQVQSNFASNSSSLKTKAEQEGNRLGC